MKEVDLDDQLIEAEKLFQAAGKGFLFGAAPKEDVVMRAAMDALQNADKVIGTLTKELDEWKAKAEAYKQQIVFAESGFIEKDKHRTAQLADTCGTLHSANLELLAENARLRRKLERKK